MTAPARPGRVYPYHLAVEATLRDTDGVGHVNNAVYVSWLEEVRTKYVIERRAFRSLQDLDFILASVHVDYRSPVLLLETVDLWCGPSRVGNRSFELVYEGRARGDGRLVVEARSVQVQYDYRTRRAVPVPDSWRKGLEADLVH
jgi:acyl-CoA thioester hydrolase